LHVQAARMKKTPWPFRVVQEHVLVNAGGLIPSQFAY
jgi:hypothetical protein